MKNAFALFVAKIDVRIVLFVLVIALFALAAGAPSATITIGG